MLEVRDLHLAYRNRPALRGFDLTVGDNQVVALLGPNGAGKTSLLRAVSGIVRPSAGTITFDGARLDRMRPGAIVATGVVQVPERRRIFPGLTVLENLSAGAFTRRRRAPGDVEWALGLFPGLREVAHRLAGGLPVGEQQALALARALVSRPRLLLVDELSLGLAPLIVSHLLPLLGEARDAGTTIVLVEQSADVALSIADRAVFMEKGEVRFEGPTKQLLERSDIARAVFLGGHSNGNSARTRVRA